MTTAVVRKAALSPLEISARRLFPGLHNHAFIQLIEGIKGGTIRPSAALYEDNGNPATRLAWTSGFIGLPKGGAELLALGMSSQIRSASWMCMLEVWSLR